MNRLLSRDDLRGSASHFSCDADGKVTISNVQRFDGLLDQNEKERNGYRKHHHRGDQKHVRKVAEIPEIIFHELEAKFGRPEQNPKAWKKWLNNYDNRFFRTSQGSL